VSTHAKAVGLGGRTIVLKLKTTNFRIRTRSVSLDSPTQLADRIFRVTREALRRESDGTAFRLLGVGLSQLSEARDCDPTDLIDDGKDRRAAAERAMDRVREKFGGDAVSKGRSAGRSTVGR
jgi:DNA polymerase-4